MPHQYRADHIGSLLRPPAVQTARAHYQAGRIDPDELRAAEDVAIRNALHQQQAIGLPIYTDGEFRRAGFQNDLIDTVEGFIQTPTPAVTRTWQGPGGQPAEQGTRQVVGAPLRPRRPLTGNQLPFLKTHAPGPVKITLPSPSQFPAISYQPGLTDQYYPTRSQLLWAIADIIKAEIARLLTIGVDYLQIDAPRYSYYVDPAWRRHLQDLGENPDQMFDEALAADAYCLQDAQQPGVTLALHICRGNNQSKWYAQGGYEPIAEKLFANLPVHRFLLEYDTQRAGAFDPLRFIPPGKTAVLGLISTKTPTLEPTQTLLRRIDEAAAHLPLDQLALSPQCGFASTAPGNLLTEEQQWQKLALVTQTAAQAWPG